MREEKIWGEHNRCVQAFERLLDGGWIRFVLWDPERQTRYNEWKSQ